MGAPQIIGVTLMIIHFGMVCNKHGQRRDNWNITEECINALLTLGLLWWGGFFK